MSEEEAGLDTVWVFGFDAEPDVKELVSQVEALLGDEELEGTVKEARHGEDPRGHHLWMQFASQRVAEYLCLSLDDLVDSRTLHAKWTTRLTGQDVTWEEAWDSQVDGLPGLGTRSDGAGDGLAGEAGAVPALVVVTFRGDASWRLVQHMVDYLIDCGFPVKKEDFDWDQQKVVSLKVPGI